MANLNVFMIIFGVVFVLVSLVILGTSGFIFFNVFRVFGRVSQNLKNIGDEATTHAEKKGRVLDVVAKQPVGTPAYKCRGCGATVDSTAELSPDGKIRCNYCNQWSSIYQ